MCTAVFCVVVVVVEFIPQSNTHVKVLLMTQHKGISVVLID